MHWKTASGSVIEYATSVSLRKFARMSPSPTARPVLRSPAAVWGLWVLWMALAVAAQADIVQPVSVQWTEQEPNLYLVQWQIPKSYPAPAMPQPVLPESCHASGERTVQDRQNAWLLRRVYRCDDGLAGLEIGVDYPIVMAAQSTMLRVDLLSGERRVHVLAPGEDRWRVPEIDAGWLSDPWPNIRRAVLDGTKHALAGWPHWALWLAFALLGRGAGALRLATAFTVGQLGGVAGSALTAVTLPVALAEAGVALAVVILTAEALGSVTRRSSQLAALTLLAGLLHGLGLAAILPAPASFATAGWLYPLSAVIGMDAILLVLVGLSSAYFILRADQRTGAGLARGLGYALGGVAVAGALVLVVSSPIVEARSTANTPGGDASRLPGLEGAAATTGMPGSRRMAPQRSDASVQSFLAVEAFEVRHQILVRLRDVAAELGVEPATVLEIEAQPDVKSKLQELLVPRVTVAIDGAEVRPLVDRIDFLTVDSLGVLPRTEPRPEIVDETYLGLTLAYLTLQTPATVELSWDRFLGGAEEIPVTVSDPESSSTQTLTPAEPRLVWRNRLAEDPIPTVAAIVVAPATLPVPLASLPLLALVAWLLLRTADGQRSTVRFAAARVAFTLALLAAPLSQVAVAMPTLFDSGPSVGQARRILAGVLPNVYRAFEFRDEAAVYDRLAVSVTGDTLTEVYLEHRQALEMEERGGARARVVAVEVSEVRSVNSLPGGGFEAEAVWIVGGSVTHFGHRHFRQNRYDARVMMVPSEGNWKIRTLELLDEERLR